MPMGMVQDGETFYFAYDQVGSLRAVTDAEGGLAKTVRYDSFGNIIADTNPEFAVPFGFAGGLYDKDTGLVRFGFRDYDSVIGRWTAKDPIGFNGGDTNVYVYANQNPITWFDPDGLTRDCPERIEGLIAEKQFWRDYPGNSKRYHCGFKGFLEIREKEDCDETPVGECFYDCSGRLVDENHKYKGCRGTADEYPVSDDWWFHPGALYNHMFHDSGGPYGPSDVADTLGEEARKETERYYSENPEGCGKATSPSFSQ
ncbi:hypothetical protein DPQ33_18315 [Oceanidesulfovibrio indonesiensis]|uniref:Teneurin-like YD-shell domain-containing protein n=1 Tax=Oceanidesulfovibrio indonesiensis TaxID=54767 RepID=A0A7M3MA84_9BACT|nr:hypothetical protein DPQ33_18315 [Oceanidesulfovibrio indonesiensis]